MISLFKPYCIVLFALGQAVAAVHCMVQDTPATRVEEYRALLKERENAPDDLSKAKTDDERTEVLARLKTLPLRFLALAEANPKDPIAEEALIQTVSWVNSTAFPAGGKGQSGG